MDNDVLRQAPLFSALDDEAASALRASMSENRLRRGDVLFHEGDSGDKLYIVLDGKVKLGRTSSDGRENLLAILGPGQMFGELSLFDPGPRSATVTAYSKQLTCLAINRLTFNKLFGPLQVSQAVSHVTGSGLSHHRFEVRALGLCHGLVELEDGHPLPAPDVDG